VRLVPLGVPFPPPSLGCPLPPEFPGARRPEGVLREHQRAAIRSLINLNHLASMLGNIDSSFLIKIAPPLRRGFAAALVPEPNPEMHGRMKRFSVTETETCH